ncbi:SAM50-like protein [Elsinoe australis]|uniref:SAM50-like protein n=1 Tax=Elsinoe australis TaxID=40998 RepID=A0A4U7B914_9PEZI|nr:SAM50-like protein [Elsinoe australis]
MAAASEDDVFSRLSQKVDPKLLDEREKDVASRIQAQQEKAQARQAELLGLNLSRPVTISSIRVLHATHTRRGFLGRVFDPILSNNKDGPYTFQEAMAEIGTSVDKLNRFGIFKQPVSTFLDVPDKSDPSTTPTDLSVIIAAQERGRYTIKTGTEAGSAEGSAFLDGVLRNLFGGAESLNVHASLGTRTRSAYSGFFDTPILSNPDLRFEIGGLVSSTLKPWASHEEVIKGGSSKIKWASSWGSKHELGYTGMWRQITGLAEKASPSVRADAGDSFKSSITHTWTNDKRDVPMLPSRGYLLKTVSELAGLGPLKGDVSFAKIQAESQLALPVPVPGIQGDSGISFTAGLRGGVLYPLALGGGSTPVQSRVNDRFQSGGPTDVRGFRLSGLGPRDGQDALGGDVFAAGGASLLLPFPTMGKETPLRIQAFVNGGRLLALKDLAKDKDGSMNSQQVASSVKSTIQELRNGLPTCAAGLGLVYAHPIARFELNFSLPLVIRKGEEGRKGLSFGVGIDFM